ncbi:MAG: hypothetical protein ABR610_00220 [Thermoanaerobaculia bacterium]|nr:hypothetical protein [Acidobacteriota bacterium]
MSVSPAAGRGRLALSMLLAAVFLVLFAARGNVRGVLIALAAPRTARPARALPPAYVALLSKTAELVPPDAPILYSSRVRAEALDPDSRRFASEGRPRPDADEWKEFARYVLAPRIVYARGPFEPPLPEDRPAPRHLLVVGGTLRHPDFSPLFENEAGALYVRRSP